jgi:hypothetical protein
MRSSIGSVAAAFLGALGACSANATARPVRGGPVAVEVRPTSALIAPHSTVLFAASVSGSASGAVTWSVSEPGGGTVDGSGLYTAPASTGTFHVVATSAADPTAIAVAQVVVQEGGPGSEILPPDRLTVWNPGVLGGIPARTAVCASLDAATWGNGSQDATGGIQAAVNACPAGQVVQLSAGTFAVGSGGSSIQIAKGITLRGAGPDLTTLQKTGGAVPGQEATGPSPSPIVVIGPGRYGTSIAASTNLAADAVKGSYSVDMASTSGFAAGQVVLLDEASGASWQADPAGRGQIWASPDWRVVWQKHDPELPYTDDFSAADFPSTPGSAGEWFSRLDRPTSEIKQIAAVGGGTVTFTTPVHISYRVSHGAQLSRYSSVVQGAGIEALKVVGGDNGNIRFEAAANCWARNVENTVWHDEGFAVDGSFRVEIRDSYVHDAAWAQPGGAGYAISLANGSSECLVENSIIVRANKVMVARSSGAGSVFGYNYVDDGYINTNPAWIESGINGSHMVGPHHMLFEGNYGFNADSDKTHGNSVYHTFFRNHLRGVRAATTAFGASPGTTVTIDDGAARNGPRRCAGLGYYSYWHSFVGNVLGASGQMAGWSYEGSFRSDTPGIWLLGWDDWDPYPSDPRVTGPLADGGVFRHGNWDFVTSSVAHWESGYSTDLPDSLYLPGKPAFFGASPWPWVDPSTGATYTLPAKARYDAGTPNAVP